MAAAALKAIQEPDSSAAVKQLPCPALQLRKDAGAATATVSTSKESYFTVMRFGGGRRALKGSTVMGCAGRTGAMFLQEGRGEVVFERFWF